MGQSSLIETPMLSGLERFLDLSVFRQSLVTSNLANIDTPGYHTRDIDFARELQRAGGGLEYASFSPNSRLVQGLIERPDGNNVNLERETMLLARTQLGFNTCVQLMRAEFHRLSLAISGGSSS